MRIASITIEKKVRTDLRGGPVMFTCRFYAAPKDDRNFSENDWEVSVLTDRASMTPKEAGLLLRDFATGIEKVSG